MLNLESIADMPYVQTTWGDFMPRDRNGVKVNLECFRCKKIFQKVACQIRPEQNAFYCSRGCLAKTKEEKLIGRRANSKRYREKNYERVLTNQRKWRRENSETVKAMKRADWVRHRDKYVAIQKAYYDANKDEIRRKQKLRYHDNKEVIQSNFREWYAQNRDKALARQEKYRLENRKSGMRTRCKKSARNKGVAFDLTHEWLQERLDRGFCELSGIPFDMTGKRSRNSPSVDRRNPQGGYTMDNCRLILWSINRALSNYGEDYLFDVFEKILHRKSIKVAA